MTEKGKIEAELLARQIKSFNIDDVYVSPLGRAQKTADYSLEELGIKAVTLEWLQEFPALFDPSIANEKTREAYKNELVMDESGKAYKKRIVWDIMPSYYTNHPELFDANEWKTSEIAAASNVVQEYNHVIKEFDQLMAEHGYVRDGIAYDVRESNDKTLAFFCHFGITCVILSHLWNVSPFVTLQFLAMAPTSLTEVVTEEREKGVAIFRTLRIGDITHLAMGNEKPSFSARFCERFENSNERH